MKHFFLLLRGIFHNGYELKYYPPKKDCGYPFALICPGGGYTGVMSSIEGEPFARALNELGYPAFVLRYRVRDKARLPAPMDDLARAVREIMDGNGSRWQVKCRGYSVWGSSAGGHLAASFGTETLGYIRYQLPKPAALILTYPVITMGEFTHPGSRDALLGKTPSQSEIDAASIENLVTDSYPPAFLWNSAEDELVPPCNAEMLAAKLEQNHIPYAFKQFPSGRHGCGLGKGTPCEPWFAMAIEFWEKRRDDS